MDDTKFHGKYRTQTTRLRSWDYAADGWYFVTICTLNRQHFFGELVNDAMQLSRVGEAAALEWTKTAEIRTCVYLDAWVVMPNHMHGIVIIEKQAPATSVETRCVASLPPATNTPPAEPSNKFSPLKKDCFNPSFVVINRQ
jgi:hypothetical protein